MSPDGQPNIIMRALFLVLVCLELHTHFAWEMQQEPRFMLNYGVVFEPKGVFYVGDKSALVEVTIEIPQVAASNVSQFDSSTFCADINVKVAHISRHVLRQNLCRRILPLARRVSELQQMTLRKVTSKLQEISDIINSRKDMFKIKTTRRRSVRSALLPVIGDLSKYLFGTATMEDINNQGNSISQLSEADAVNTDHLRAIGSTLHSALLSINSNMALQLEAAINQSNRILTLSREFKDYRTFKKYEDGLLRESGRLSRCNLQLDSIFSTLIKGTLALHDNILHPDLITYSDMEQLRGLLQSKTDSSNFWIPTPSEMYRYASVNKPPVLEGPVLKLSLKVPLLPIGEKFTLYKINTFPLPLHGHFTQLYNMPSHLLISEKKYAFPSQDFISRCHGELCSSAIPFRLTSDLDSSCALSIYQGRHVSVKDLCDFRLIVSTSTNESRMSLIYSGHYLFSHVNQFVMKCANGTRTEMGCTSCVRSLPCNCKVTSNQWIIEASDSNCQRSSSRTVYPVNLAVLQELNLTLSMLIHPSFLYNKPLPIDIFQDTSDLVDRQNYILQRERGNLVKLSNYLNELTMSRHDFEEHRARFKKNVFSNGNFNMFNWLSESNVIYMVNMSLTFVGLPLCMALLAVVYKRQRLLLLLNKKHQVPI